MVGEATPGFFMYKVVKIFDHLLFLFLQLVLPDGFQYSHLAYRNLVQFL